MRTIERVMRVMTQVNVGATLGMAAWMLWSGVQVVSGEWQRQRPAVPAPAAAQPTTDSCCFVPAKRAPLQTRADPAWVLAAAGRDAP